MALLSDHKPDGRRIAYVRRVPSPDTPANQVFVVTVDR
jgi:hypothetical protein